MQTLEFRQPPHGGCNMIGAFTIQFLNRYELDEIQDTEPTTKTGAPAGRKHVVGPRSVITRRLRRVITNEDGSR